MKSNLTDLHLTKAQWRMLRLGERYVHGSGEVRTGPFRVSTNSSPG